MIGYLRGKIGQIEPESVILETGGVGYEIFMPSRLLAQLPAVGTEAIIFTHLQVSDNEFRLYGFLTRDELKLFKILLNISGIGAKAALNIIGFTDAPRFYNFIAAQDEKSLVQIPGIGKKSAQRILFELKDKVELLLPNDVAAPVFSDGKINEIMEALEALGYLRAEVYPLLLQLPEPELTQAPVQDSIKKILKMKATALK